MENQAPKSGNPTRREGQNAARILDETMGARQIPWNEKPIPKAYPALDNDLARDNLENDLPLADLQDLQ